MSVIEELLQGAIDTHIHHGPDIKMERRVDALQAARQAQEVGMRAIVLKNHAYPTASLAYILNLVVPDIAVFGSITLDFEAGGLNTYALEASARLGAKIVWMPTVSSANDMKRRNPPEEGTDILNEDGNLLPVVDEILDIVKNYGMVLATGHISAPESFALVDAAVKKDVGKIVVTHPLMEWFGACLSLEEQGQMVEKGAFLEHTFVPVLPLSERLDPMKIVESVKSVGAEHCILSTDLGQNFNLAPAEGMRMMIATMLRCGLTEEEIELMVKVNPARLLGLD
ncbi:DUF6282 family protein [Chloroflexota bacterium]